MALPAVNELIWGKRQSENEQSLPRVAGMLRAAGPMYLFYAALRLPVPGARRQVYEIKAQCPINNLAAYCKKTHTQYNSYYLQQSDVYRRFKRTSLSSTCFHSMWSPKPKREERRNITSSLCLCPATKVGLMGKKTLQCTNYSGLCWLPFPATHLPLSLL